MSSLDCAGTPEPAPPHLPHSFIYDQWAMLSKQLTPFFPKLLAGQSPSAPGLGTCLSSPSSPAAGGLDRPPKDLVLLLASTWFNKPFLLEKLRVVKVYNNLNISDLQTSLFLIPSDPVTALPDSSL